LSVTTGSSAVSGSALAGNVHVKTSSGGVDATLTGGGDVDVTTGSSAIRLRGVKGGLTASTQSGHVSVQGMPVRPWDATTGSSAIDFAIDGTGPFSVDATSRSGSVTLEGGSVVGSVSKQKVAGTIGGGGPLVRANSGSGAIHLSLAR
jgi:hypothetical protein